MSIGMTPFRALYGYDALSFADVVFGDSGAPKAKDWIQESQHILKDNLVTTRNQQKVCTQIDTGLRDISRRGIWCTSGYSRVGSPH